AGGCLALHARVERPPRSGCVNHPRLLPRPARPERRFITTTHMSDNDNPGAPEQGSAGSPAPAPAPSSTAPSTTPAAASSAAPAPAGYKPTTIEVITPVSEYKNPFTGETSVSAPPANEPAPQAAPSAPIAPAAPAAPEQVREPAAQPELTEAPAAKPELNILPPEPAKRPPLSWEAPGASSVTDAPAAPRRDERPSFRPERERREPRSSFDPRDARDPREAREPRDAREPRENREPR